RLAERDRLLAAHVAAALGPDLILDEESGEAGVLESADGVDDVDRRAVPGIPVGDKRQAGALSHHGCSVEALGIADNADVRNAITALGDPGAGDERRAVSRRLDQLGTEAVKDSRHDRYTRRGNVLPESEAALLGG